LRSAEPIGVISLAARFPALALSIDRNGMRLQRTLTLHDGITTSCAQEVDRDPNRQVAGNGPGRERLTTTNRGLPNTRKHPQLSGQVGHWTELLWGLANCVADGARFAAVLHPALRSSRRSLVDSSRFRGSPVLWGV